MAKQQDVIQIKDLELQGLSNIAAQFARLNPDDPALAKDTELLEITLLSRKYLKCLLHKAIERWGTEINNSSNTLS